jgi:two-component system, OmpR family, response regulator
MQVFVVEDSSLVRARLLDMLQALPGASVVGEATRADTAIRGILATRPDLVLLDMNLGEGSGFDVLRAVCRQAPGIDFYMLSNFAADPYRQLAQRLGARDFFDKSKEMERVRDLVAQRAAVNQ